MKIAKTLLTCALSLALFSACGNSTGIISVNGVDIPKSEYDKKMEAMYKTPQFVMLGDAAKDPDNMFNLMAKDRIVNELIIKELFDQEIEKRKIEISDEEFTKGKEDIIKTLGGEEKLKELMKQNDVSEKQINDDIKVELQMAKLVDEIGGAKVSDKDVKNYYNKNKQAFNYPDRVRASHILISANPMQIKQEIIIKDKGGKLTAAEIEAKVKAEQEKALKLAKEIQAKAKANPADFSKLAKKHSADTVSAARGGDLGYFPKEAMVEPFSQAAFSQKVNEVGEVVETQYGYHIILVADRAKAGLEPYDKVAPEIKTYLEQTKKVETLQKLFDGLKSSADIKYLDESYNPTNIQAKIKEQAQNQPKILDIKPLKEVNKDKK